MGIRKYQNNLSSRATLSDCTANCTCVLCRIEQYSSET